MNGTFLQSCQCLNFAFMDSGPNIVFIFTTFSHLKNHRIFSKFLNPLRYRGEKVPQMGSEKGEIREIMWPSQNIRTLNRKKRGNFFPPIFAAFSEYLNFKLQKFIKFFPGDFFLPIFAAFQEYLNFKSQQIHQILPGEYFFHQFWWPSLNISTLNCKFSRL